MNYLISTFNCYLFGEENFKLEKGVAYQIVKCDKLNVIFSNENCVPFMLDLKQHSENMLKVCYEHDTYYFIFPKPSCLFYTTTITCKTDKIVINLSNNLCVEINGVLISEKNVENLKFSHYEIDNDLCLIYFTGNRDFLLAIKSGKLIFANYYDEYNVHDKEKYFMCRLNDSLNHGSVCKINNNIIETYLVYLDEEEMNIKSDFIPFVFLDCMKAKNYGYCKNLLSDELCKCEHLENFFPEFDYFYPLKDKAFALLKKNTLSGIFKFEVLNNQIINIIEV